MVIKTFFRYSCNRNFEDICHNCTKNADNWKANIQDAINSSIGHVFAEQISILNKSKNETLQKEF